MKDCILRQKLPALIRKPRLGRTTLSGFLNISLSLLLIVLASVRPSVLTTLYTLSVV